ncbi:hypothetical protein TST_0470 [Thermosulfidibacter takaii ABI70S6]|uniref:ATP-grasp domain-containing protein n=1 Tax=Thermosulfidibacter takaii (strain DSM 17441 / JCM 13301 / NBRC 103674 / ABI70S6) TaxID=1298851 RepID=A0A0S3QSI8_THET7|nr:acetate--CoA ligase family protein [Thermosulfidibacter takaii]BAT71277.1 hypothetical protein TST_0470 [Thermosulfidibacter takaii ABI70S6]
MLKKLADIFRKENWEERFLVGKKKAKKILDKLKKQGKTELTTESMEIMEYYGVPVADFKVVTTKRDIYAVAEEIGLPVVVKSVTSKAVHRGDIGSVYIVREKEEIEEAYPQVLGEIATRMPWVALTGILVQKYIPGEEKCEIKIERVNKEPKFKALWRKIFGDKKEEETHFVEKREDMDQIGLEEDFAGVFAFALQFKEVQKLEADFIKSENGWVLVDSKVWLFE